MLYQIQALAETAVGENVKLNANRDLLDQRHTIKLDTLAMRRKMYYDNRNNLHLMS